MDAASRSRLWLGAVLVATFAVFAISLGNGFTLDDRAVALGIDDTGQPNRLVYELQPLSVYFSTHYWAHTHETGFLFRPVTVLSFALRHALFGDAALPGHLANLLLHVLATWLTFRMLVRLGAGRAAALAGAAVFGLHAVHSEVVASIVGRAELLAFCGGAAAVLLTPRAGTKLPGLAIGAAAALLLFIAFCAKESGLTWVPFLFVFPCAERWMRREPLDRDTLVALAARTVGIVAVPLVLYFLLRQNMIAGLSGEMLEPHYGMNPLFAAPLATRLLGAVTVLGYGLLLCVAPFRLASDYGSAVFPVGAFHWTAALAAVLLVAALVLAWRARRERPLLFLAAAAFFLFTALTSNVLVPIGTIFGERLLYAPSLAASFSAAHLVRRPLGNARPLAIGALAVWLGASAWVSVTRSALWKNDEVLAMHDVEVQRRSVRLQRSAAGFLSAKGDGKGALARLRRAAELDPEDALTWSALAAAQLAAGDLAGAEASARRGLRAEHARGDRDRYMLHGNLGLVELRRGRIREGVSALAAALCASPSFYAGWLELYELRTKGKITAKQLLNLLYECERRVPGKPHWVVYRGILAHHERQFEAAVRMFEPSLPRLGARPHDVALRSQARFSYGRSLLEVGRKAQGIAVLEQLASDAFATAETREAARQLRERER